MMRKSNIFYRKLQLVVSKRCTCTDTSTKWKTVHEMYTTLHCRVTCVLKISNIIDHEGLKINGPFSQSRSHIIYIMLCTLCYDDVLLK